MNTRLNKRDRAPGDLFAGTESLPSIVYNALRGRLVRTGLIAAALAVPLALFGFMSTVPMHGSKGIVRIKPSREQIVYSTQSNKLKDYYHDYVQAEAERLRGGRVYQIAVEDPALREIGWPEGEAGRRALRRVIKVPATYSGTIKVTALHPRGEISEAAVNSVLRAYMTMQDEELKLRTQGMTGSYEEVEAGLRETLVGLQAQAAPMIDKYGVAGTLGDQVKAINAEIVDISGELRRAKSSVDSFDTQIERRSEALAALRDGQSGIGPNADQLALTDTRLGKLRDQKRMLQARLKRSIENGLLTSHPVVVIVQEDIGLLEGLIGERLTALEQQWWTRYQADTDELISKRALEQRRIGELQTVKADNEAQRRQMLGYQQELVVVTGKIELIEKELASIVEKKTQQITEADAAHGNELFGQAQIYEWGELSAKPTKDSRVLRAAAGVVFGLMLAVGGVVGLGQVNRRVRYIDEIGTKRMGVPCLGVVPLITGEQSADSLEVYEMIDHARGLLELGDSTGGGASVLTVTSAGAGDGKSTLARALASSFARAGQRTLLIDADPHGRSSTRRLGGEGRSGLNDCLSSPEVEGIVETSIDGLWLMPAGQGGGSSSYAAVDRLIEDLRSDFDRIIVDTGPIFGSVEANLMARVSDGTVLVVSHGQPRKQIEKALDRLDEIAAKCVGMVFNRAEQNDYIKSAAPISSVARRDVLPDITRPVDSRSNGRSPLRGASSVVGAYS